MARIYLLLFAPLFLIPNSNADLIGIFELQTQEGAHNLESISIQIDTNQTYSFEVFTNKCATIYINRGNWVFADGKLSLNSSESYNSNYTISEKGQVLFSDKKIDSENSENLEESITNNIETFSNYFLGFQFEYKIPKNDFFFNNTFNLEINPSFGKRIIENSNSNQFKIETSASYLWDISNRNSIFIRNKIGYLNSDDFIDNELFRVGGANSIRGFNEQSIYTDKYLFFNIEYRYLTSQKSYLYTIVDIGRINTTLKEENLYGIGLGYLFTTNNSQINISTVVGKNSSQNLDFENSKLIINWKSFF